MLKHPDKLVEISDVIANGVLSYAKACRAVGLPTRTFWEYIKRSQAGDEELMIEYLGDTIPFHKAVNAARRMALHEMRGRMEEKSIFGYDEPVFFQGMPTWKPDPRCVGIDDPDIRELMGFPRDGLLRDENGNVVQNVIHHEPPVALQLRVAEMAFPTEYRPGTNNTVAVSGGLAVIGAVHVKPSASGERPVIPPAPVPPLPQLTVLDDSAPDQLAIPETDEEPEQVAAEAEPGVPPSPEPVIREAAPAQYTPPPQSGPLAAAERSGRPLSELERDLLSRARGPVEKRSAPVGSRP